MSVQENAFKPTVQGVADIGQALRWMKEGHRVFREGWNGKSMWLALVRSGDWGCAYAEYPSDRMATPIKQPLPPIVVMKTTDGTLVPWLCSQTDLQATDWMPVAKDV